MTGKKKETDKKSVNVFTKEQILKAKKYIHLQDIVNVLLFDSKTYTLEEVDTLISNFMKGKVK